MLGELEAMGLTLDDLLAAAGRDVPARAGGITVAEYLPTVAAAYLPRTRRTYNSYWTLTVELVGELALDRVTIEDLMGVAEEAARRAQVRRPGSDGRASRESCVAAMRAIFARALKAGLVSSNPALLVDKPRRLPNRRRALSPVELDELWEAVTATTRDPELDVLLLRFHLESGARRMGAINLRVRDLDEGRQTIWLREKFGAEREQPISRSLLDAISRITVARGVRCRSVVRLSHPRFCHWHLHQGRHQRGRRRGRCPHRRTPPAGGELSHGHHRRGHFSLEFFEDRQ